MTYTQHQLTAEYEKKPHFKLALTDALCELALNTVAMSTVKLMNRGWNSKEKQIHCLC